MHTDSETAQELADRVHRLLEEVVLPVERDLAPEPSRTSVRPPASTTCAPYRHTAEYGEMGRGFREVLPPLRGARAVVARPEAMRVAAPDEGNMHLFELLSTDF
jgi:acyl-CoA dehydrogenase